MAGLLALNFSIDMEDTYFDTIKSDPLRILALGLMQGIPYYLVCLFTILLTKSPNFFKNKRFWLISGLGFLVLGLDRASHFHEIIAGSINNPYFHAFTNRVMGNFASFFTVVLPFYIIYKFILKKDLNHFYGIRKEKGNLKPYGIMLLIMIPLILAASFQKDFLQMYPIYKKTFPQLIIDKYNTPELVLVSIFELSYSFSFFIVELVFRGYFIFALVKIMGKEVVLPMATTYCVLHFGKPLGEAISSFFGGYLLGLIALKTENIYGGILVHIGIALLMEFFAFIQYLP